MTADYQIVHILSTNYAGSHFLTLQLASNSRCISAGEFHRFRKGSDRKRQECRICESDDVCPLHKGLRATPVRELYPQLMRNIRAYDPTIRTVIDNSKKIKWAKRWLHLEGVRKKYIHLVRDPRALVRRWIMNLESTSEKTCARWLAARRCLPAAWDILRGSEANVYLWKWLNQNKKITRFLAHNGLDAKVVTYHDLVYHPDQILQGLMEWIGHEYEPDQREYWRFTHHGSVKPQYMSAPTDGKRIFDQRWREFLSPEDQQRALNHAGIQRYLAENGIEFSEADGLIGSAGQHLRA